MAIIVSKNGRGAQRVEECGVKEESYLQDYVAGNPNTLPFDELKKGKPRLLVVAREFATRSGPIDVLAVDGDGDIYIIETKLFKNPDKRKVVAQVLDYGASLWKGYGDPDAFIADVDSAIAEESGNGLRQQLRTLYASTDDDVEETLRRLKRNLADGQIQFVVLMDRLSEELRDLILFINAKSRFSIYAVEMEFYRHEGMEIVIPHLHGAEVKKEVCDPRSVDPKWAWDEQRFMKEASQLKPDVFAAVKQLLEFTKGIADEVAWKCLTFQGGGKCNVVIEPMGRRRLYSLDTDGTLLLDFQEPGGRRCQDLRAEFRRRLVAAGFLRVPRGHGGQKIGIDPRDWVAKLSTFQETLTAIVGKCRRDLGSPRQT